MPMNFGGEAIPASFRELVEGRAADVGVSGDDWLASLPGIVDHCVRQWSLRLDGPVWHGQCALVLPCHRDGEPVVLKVSWPHEEARLEHLALQNWHGRGAVRLLAADPAHWAMLLESVAHDADLTDPPLLDAIEVIGGLFTRLDRPATPQFTRLSECAERWITLCRSGSRLVPRRLTDQAAGLLSELAPDCDGRLIHRDLHYENVLAAQREPWLAIDPKPLSGEWEFAVAPLLWNRWDHAAAAHNVRTHLRLRLGVVAEAAGLDESRALAWTFARMVLNAVWEAQEPIPDDEWISQCITIAKAMTD
ncbi:aminoglycoside phosphotransferase family protein [Rudaeicoccus suwonensis]|uniref:Streptomycin 6-kinase n=1 Tax=Rudaeicoccus suwonensis TaxID=657409 RepID=A0A561E9H5_9MICO|nr:aminoglycoside phosphotransferase family protein [Rudaeicoccus suwonensis]TWE12278.1 streptomycin 6-kinase [Rudaeicoccus suwonensis]